VTCGSCVGVPPNGDISVKSGVRGNSACH
jgi:hypothetical protein